MHYPIPTLRKQIEESDFIKEMIAHLTPEEISLLKKQIDAIPPEAELERWWFEHKLKHGVD